MHGLGHTEQAEWQRHQEDEVDPKDQLGGVMPVLGNDSCSEYAEAESADVRSGSYERSASDMSFRFELGDGRGPGGGDDSGRNPGNEPCEEKRSDAARDQENDRAHGGEGDRGGECGSPSKLIGQRGEENQSQQGAGDVHREDEGEDTGIEVEPGLPQDVKRDRQRAAHVDDGEGGDDGPEALADLFDGLRGCFVRAGIEPVSAFHVG